MTTDTWISLEADGYPGYEINASGDVRTLDGELVPTAYTDEGYLLDSPIGKGIYGTKRELLAGHFGNPEINYEEE